jgi:hypothetical protein
MLVVLTKDPGIVTGNMNHKLVLTKQGVVLKKQGLVTDVHTTLAELAMNNYYFFRTLL